MARTGARRRPPNGATPNLFGWQMAREERLRPPPPPPEFRVLDSAKIEVRPYLLRALDEWARGGNIGIVADTATGKTYLAYAIADAVLAAGQRVLFSAPTVALCEQHAALARMLFRLPEGAVRFVSAMHKPERRAGVWAEASIAIATPQTMANELRAGRLACSDVGLVIIDEGHHAAQTHASIAVARAASARGARILALTASPGGDAERIERIRTNLHLERWVRISEEDTAAFRPPVATERTVIPIDLRAQPIITALEDLLERLTTELAAAGYLAEASRVPSPAALATAQERIRTERAFTRIPTVTAAQQVLVALTYTVSTSYTAACTSLRTALDRQSPHGGCTVTARRLRTTPEVRTALAALDALVCDTVSHPKEEALIARLRHDLADVERSHRVLVFHRYVEGVQRITELLRNALGVEVRCALGRERMRSDLLIATLRAYADGAFPILVATDVIREGIHVPEIDLLIVMTPPRNERELIQLHGRVGRTAPGRIVTILADHPIDTRYAFSAESRAKRMREIIPPAAPTIASSHGVTHRSAFTGRPRKPPEGFVDRLGQNGSVFVFERFRVCAADVRRGRTHRPFVIMTVGDRTGRVTLYHWCSNGMDPPMIVRTHPVGSVVIVRGMFKREGEFPRIIVDPGQDHGITACPSGDYDPTEYERA